MTFDISSNVAIKEPYKLCPELGRERAVPYAIVDRFDSLLDNGRQAHAGGGRLDQFEGVPAVAERFDIEIRPRARESSRSLRIRG